MKARRTGSGVHFRLLAFAFLFTFNLTSFAAVVPLLAQALGQGAGEIGITLAIPGFLGLSFVIAGSGIANRFGRRSCLTWAFALCAVASVLFILSGFWELVAAQVGAGIGAALFWPTFLSLVADAPGVGDDANVVQGRNSAAQAAGALVGAFLPLALGGLYDLRAAFVPTLLSSVTGIVLAMRVTEVQVRGESVVREVAQAYRSILILAARRGSVLAGAMTSFPFVILWWVGGTSFFLLFATHAGISAEDAGLLIGLKIAIAGLLRVAFHRVVGRLGYSALIMGGTIVAAGGLTMPVLLPIWEVFVLSAILQGVGLAGMHPSANALVASGTSGEERAVAYGLPVIVSQFGLLLSPVVLGMTGVVGGYGWSLIAAAMMSVAGSIVVWRLLGEPRGEALSTTR